MNATNIILLGYSGHAYSVMDAIGSCGYHVLGYLERAALKINPYHITYLGCESNEDDLNKITANAFLFPAVGENAIRKKMMEHVFPSRFSFINIIHTRAIVSEKVTMGAGIFIGMGAMVNACSKIESGVIINTGAIVEHECAIGAFTHIAPGAVLCGNVKIGSNSFIGANTVIKQGLQIGNNCVIGAGSVVLKDIPDDSIVWGNPARIKLNEKK